MAWSWWTSTDDPSLMVHTSDNTDSAATNAPLFGKQVYVVDATSVRARGYAITQEQLDELRRGRLHDILSDSEGRIDTGELFRGLELTEFGTKTVAEVLQPPVQEDHSRGWREGEALAEIWLIDAESCEFPWPFNRDLRHPRASLPGAELVGFTGDKEGPRFAFAQVKTSKQQQFPPAVVHQTKHGLVAQLAALRDDRSLKNCVVMYLTYRAKPSEPWYGRFQSAAIRYFNSGTTAISLFGVLVRDVPPDANDLAKAAERLCNEDNTETRIALYGLYLPIDSIPKGPQHSPRPKRRVPG